jgi:5-methylcytosine-specific restriction endonuclease McrA
LALIEEGKISLTAARRLGPVMTDELIEWAIGKTVEEVDQKVAGIKCAAAPIAKVEQVPSMPALALLLAEPVETPHREAPKIRPDKTRFVTDEVLEYRFAASADFNKALKRARDLASKKGVGGSLEDFMRHVIEFYLEKKDPERQLSREPKERAPKTRAPKPSKPRSRPHISVAVKRAVTKRAGYQCAHVHKDGRRCAARSGLHLDHITPIAKGGAYCDPTNLRWLCPAHNRLAAEREFGQAFVAQRIVSNRVMSRNMTERAPPRPKARPVTRLQRAGELDAAEARDVRPSRPAPRTPTAEMQVPLVTRDSSAPGHAGGEPPRRRPPPEATLRAQPVRSS